MKNNTYEELIHKPLIDCGFFGSSFSLKNNNVLYSSWDRDGKTIKTLELKRYLIKTIENKTVFTARLFNSNNKYVCKEVIGGRDGFFYKTITVKLEKVEEV